VTAADKNDLVSFYNCKNCIAMT